MSVQVAPAARVTPWPYAEYMARWERQVERRQLFLRSYHFSRDTDTPARSPRARARRVVWAGPRRLRRAAASGLRRLRARLRLCFGWAAARRRPRGSSGRAGNGFRYGRLSGGCQREGPGHVRVRELLGERRRGTEQAAPVEMPTRQAAPGACSRGGV